MKYNIQWKTFFRKGLKPLKESEGMVFLYTGKQGSGKSYAAVKYAAASDRPVIANFHMEGALYATFSQMLKVDTRDCLVIIDEVFKFYVKGDKVDKTFLSWLAQSRKNNRTVILIAQEFLETPLPLRRFGRFLVNFRRFGPIIIETWADGWTLAYDKEIGEYTAQPYKIRIYKRNLSIAERYDTLERIEE